MTTPTPDLENLHAYLDDELSPAARTAFAARIETDVKLAAALAAEQRFRTELSTLVQRTSAPATLQRKVRLALAPPLVLPWWRRGWLWLATPQPIRPLAGVAALLLVILVGGAFWWVGQPTTEAPQALDVLFQRHEIYFEKQPALDVTGDAAQVDAWFSHRVPYPVQAPLLSDDWQLVGGRLDEFQQARMAHLLYMRGNGQRTSLTIFPRHLLPTAVGKQVQVAEQSFGVTDNGVHRAIFWSTAQDDYVLIGDIAVPEAALLQLAVEARAQLPS